ncbi:MAG: hypothetical protein L0H31_02310 [Nocardioidaceae bacterium]|nr:hypothetical protein [Nocardioidaceae bacterium]
MTRTRATAQPRIPTNSATKPPPAEHEVTLALPRQWSTRHHPSPDVVVVSRARAVPASGFRPGLVVHSQLLADLPPDGASCAGTVPGQRTEVEDHDAFDLNGHHVDYRRLSHQIGRVEVVDEQWAWLIDEVVITLTCSVALEDYLDYGDLFEQVADTVEIRLAPLGPPR